MSPATPGMPEVTRRLDEVVTRLEKLAATLEAGYVRKDVLQARLNTTDVQLAGIEDEVHSLSKRIAGIEEKAATNWRLAITSLILPLFITIFGAVLYYALHGR